MARYWVIGGEYADTRFERLASGAREERHGPFPSYDEAYRVWQARARATIDDALVRFRLREAGRGFLALRRQITPSREVRSSSSSGVGTA